MLAPDVVHSVLCVSGCVVCQAVGPDYFGEAVGVAADRPVAVVGEVEEHGNGAASCSVRRQTDRRPLGRDTRGFRWVCAGGVGSAAQTRPQLPRACSARDHARGASPGWVRPPERIEYGERVEVIPPADHLASFERENRDVAVGVGCAGRDNAAF
jgi:hypothetical protein